MSAQRRSIRMRRPNMFRSREGITAVSQLLFVILVGLIGPLVASHSTTAPVGAPGQPPSGAALLGTDALGRDVLSRVLHGGLTVLGLGTAATVSAYIVGVGAGMIAGYSRGWRDATLMRGVDILLSFPALLLLLLLVTGLGSGIPVLIFGVAIVLVPGIVRIVRTAALEVSTRSYVEDAIARGESLWSICVKEILPNITPIILADFGIRFGYAIILMASVNYLGLGLKPPTADWGLMISENREVISTNPWAVVAPAAMLALLTVAVNLVADAYVRALGHSAGAEPPQQAQAAEQLMGIPTVTEPTE